MQKVSRFFITYYELEQIARKSKSKMISNNQKQNCTHVGKQHFATKISLLFFFGILISCNVPKEREELFVIKSGNKYGFINQKGDIVITPQFESVYGFGDYSIAPFKMDGKWGYLNKKGEIVVAAQFDEAKTFSDDSLARFKMDDNWGYINTRGNIMIPAQFEYATPMYEGHAIVETENGLGVIDKTGKLTTINIPNCYLDKEFDDHYFSEGLAPIEIMYSTVYDDGFTIQHPGYTYVDYHGDTIKEEIAFVCHNGISRTFHNRRAAFQGKLTKRNGKWNEYFGFIDKNGDTIIGAQYDWVSVFSEGIAMIGKDNKCGYIDTIGNVIIEPSFDGWGPFNKGICAVKSNDKWGFIDKSGEYVINPSFEMVSIFSEGLSWVKQDNKWGAIDTCGNMVIPALYNSRPKMFDRGLALIVENERWMYVNKTGDTIWRDEAMNIDIPRSVFDIDLEDLYDIDNNKSEYRNYFTQNIRDLDRIEGMYQVYCKEVVKNMYTGDITKVQPQPSEYWVVFNVSDVYSETTESNVYAQFCRCFCDDCGNTPNHNQYSFTRIGTTNAYDISGPNGVKGSLRIEDPIQISFAVECWQNDYGRVGYLEYELIKDYPTEEMYDNVVTSDWSGTGFAIDDGYIATNYHVINGAGNIYISWKEDEHTEKLNVQIVAIDEKNDIAILKIIDSRFKGLDNIPYGFNTALANEGEEVFVLGYPLTSTMGEEIKLTNGIISSTKGYKDDASMYQISAPIQPGNSGGPLFDSDGNVIGIIRAKHSEAENAGYAVKAIYLENLIKSSGISASITRASKLHSSSLSKKVKKVKGFVYKIECSK